MRVEQQLNGDFLQMPVERIFISEAGRSGVGTYAPHDPTTADLADLIGSVDLSKVAEYGDEGDPRAWSWSGAVYAASRGMLEMIEILKVKREFLYLLLTLTQEKNVKVSRFPLIYLDETIIAHTNLAEFRKFLQESENHPPVTEKFFYVLNVSIQFTFGSKNNINDFTFKSYQLFPKFIDVTKNW
jgi:serine protein kinase